MSSTDSNDVIKSDKNKMAGSVNKLGVQGTLLFLDQLLVAAGGCFKYGIYGYSSLNNIKN